MEDKISQLTDKLLKEGVEKGNEEKTKIIESAQLEAETVVSDAKNEAEKIIAEAKSKAEEILKNGESELKLSGNQAVGALKQKITDLIMVDTVDSTVKESLLDPKVMTEYIKTALKNWEGDNTSVDIILPETQKESLEGAITKALKGVLSGGVSISFSKSVKGGFQVAPSGESYKVTFSDEDFAAFFKEYLRPKVRSILFGE